MATGRVRGGPEMKINPCSRLVPRRVLSGAPRRGFFLPRPRTRPYGESQIPEPEPDPIIKNIQSRLSKTNTIQIQFIQNKFKLLLQNQVLLSNINFSDEDIKLYSIKSSKLVVPLSLVTPYIKKSTKLKFKRVIIKTMLPR